MQHEECECLEICPARKFAFYKDKSEWRTNKRIKITSLNSKRGTQNKKLANNIREQRR